MITSAIQIAYNDDGVAGAPKGVGRANMFSKYKRKWHSFIFVFRYDTYGQFVLVWN